MPKRNDIKTILVIGSGPIIIGQACEFDYSGTQAAKTLKSLGYRVILINSNPATIMTDPEFADKTYIEPIREDVLQKIIKRDSVDAILPTVGGQTALNVAMKMHEKNMLNGVLFLGANPEAIEKGEDRSKFKKAMIKIGIDIPKSRYAYSIEEAIDAAKEIGFPMIIRASFTLAGGGSGVAYNVDELKEIASKGIDASPVKEILIEESLLGWKEYEMEVVRDRADNCIIVCSIENVDPMGVHTGDSITIAPALTLTDKEYQEMRNASFKILREIGVDTGGSNVQFAINPKNGRMIVIEMNPRVSRSSALASKATGYPIAKVATLLAVGYTLDEVTNDITNTPASFEPTIDYIVTKIPKFTFEKFPQAESTLTTSMKSVGEVMAIGRSFKESIQKALCSMESGLSGFDDMNNEHQTIKNEIIRPNEKRILYVAEGFRIGLSVEDIYNMCKIDRWFLNQIKEIIELEKNIDDKTLSNESRLREAKNSGFSDIKIAYLINKNSDKKINEEDVYLARKNLKIALQYNEVDTCSAEFEALTPYLYSTTNLVQIEKLETKQDSSQKKVMIIGSGPNRIGQGIEFDYCCVHAAFALKEMNIKTIMYNCNPETVSTDYDTSDVLYFEPIDFERVRSVIELEKPDGIIVHFGGQTPLKLSKQIESIGAKIIGTTASVIDLAEDREKFSSFIEQNSLLQPENGIAFTKEKALLIADTISYPVLVRPSYVLGGRAMRIVYSPNELDSYMKEAFTVSQNSPVLIDKFLDSATELDVDAICDGKDLYLAGIMQHIEEAGIHSGDSACSLPPVSIDKDTISKIEQQTKQIALNLGVVGLLNIQFAIYKKEVYIIEVNPRASRTVPFVSKATGIPCAKVATRVMCGVELKEALEAYDKHKIIYNENSVFKPALKSHIAVKEAVFPFNKLDNADFVLGPEMKSTGEAMGISSSFGLSFAKSQFSCGNTIPTKGSLFLSLNDGDKKHATKIAKSLIKEGFSICATAGTHTVLQENNIEADKVLKLSEGRPNVVDSLKNREIDLVINTSSSHTSKNDSMAIREIVLRNNIPYFSTIAAAFAAIEAIISVKNEEIEPKSIQEYLAN
jgi:carbamoyl-phosphate synthase large subunit